MPRKSMAIRRTALNYSRFGALCRSRKIQPIQLVEADGVDRPSPSPPPQPFGSSDAAETTLTLNPARLNVGTTVRLVCGIVNETVNPQSIQNREY